jgi:hypothetical protein
MKRSKLRGLAIGMFLCVVPRLHASITYTCDSSITSNAGQAPGGTCNFLNSSTAGLYNSTFTNANASIYIKLGPVAGGESQFLLGATSYSNYKTQFLGESTDTAARATLPASEPDVSGDVFVTAAEGQALGYDVFTVNFGLMADGTTQCQLGTAGCYNGVITIGGQLYFRSGIDSSSQYDFFSIAQHETDEVLGTASCLTFSVSGSPPAASAPTKDGCTDTNGSGLAPTDLYRYSSTGTHAWINASSDHANLGAYFSVNGGATSIATYNNGPNGGDYGDFTFQSSCASDLVQDYAALSDCSPDITTDAGTPEIQLLNAVGFNLGSGALPEPASIGLMAAGLAALGVAGYRRRKRAA